MRRATTQFKVNKISENSLLEASTTSHKGYAEFGC